MKIAEEYEADVVKFGYITVKDSDEQDKSSVTSVPIQIQKNTGRGALSRYDISDYVVWDGIYRRSIIIKLNIRFITDLYLHEDDVFNGMLYCHANTVITTDLLLYRYVQSSNYSSTHNQSIDKQRRLIISGLKAARYRGDYVKQHNVEVVPLEILKYMRWVCNLRSAILAQLTYKEYMSWLVEFKKEGIYPLKYAWIKVAGWDYALKPYLKRFIHTFTINHPWLFWLPAKWFYRRK